MQHAPILLEAILAPVTLDFTGPEIPAMTTMSARDKEEAIIALWVHPCALTLLARILVLAVPDTLGMV